MTRKECFSDFKSYFKRLACDCERSELLPLCYDIQNYVKMFIEIVLDYGVYEKK